MKEGDAEGARAMAMATRVAGDKEDEGIEEGNDNEEGNGDGDVGVGGG